MKRKRQILLFIGIGIVIVSFISFIICIYGITNDWNDFWIGPLVILSLSGGVPIGAVMIGIPIVGLAKDKNFKHVSTYCIHCGKFSSQGSQFCQHCGAPLAKTCQHCGSPIDSKVKYCPHCGKPTV